MEKIKCFEIEERELYLEQVLVELNFPILFVCKDKQKDYYMAMCTDAYNLTYIVQKCSSIDISHMILRKITMREFWLQATKCWRVSTGDEPGKDVVLPVTVESLDESELPDDENYIIDDNAIKEYAMSLSTKQSYELKFSNDYFHYVFEMNEDYDDYLEVNDAQEQRKQLFEVNKSTMSIKEENYKYKQIDSDWELFFNCLEEQPAA